MNLIFRLIAVLIAGWRAGRGCNPAEEFMQVRRLSMRCWPTDLDFNFHMNNGRYLSIMDLGRVDLMLRAGLLGPILRQKKWMPVIAASTVRYRRATAPFEKFELETRLVGWDERWVFLEQRFFGASGRVNAIGLVQAAMTSKGGRVPTSELMELVGVAPDTDGKPPAYVDDWVRMLADWPTEGSVAAGAE